MSENSLQDIEMMLPEDFYDPSEIVLIGSHMKPSPEIVMDTDTQQTRVAALADPDDLGRGHMHVRCDYAQQLHLTAIKKAAKDADGLGQDPTLALVYAYGYEGHTYRLAKPRIMIVHGVGRPYEPQWSKDASKDLTGKLYMWKLSKHHQTISIEVESGELEQLVLEANQPGNRAVNSYAAHMQMSHRGGKLS